MEVGVHQLEELDHHRPPGGLQTVGIQRYHHRVALYILYSIYLWVTHRIYFQTEFFVVVKWAFVSDNFNREKKLEIIYNRAVILFVQEVLTQFI